MRGPTPKDPAVRQRRNAVTTRAALPTARAITAPDLPKGREWHQLVVEWWADVWRSPQATRWTATEKHQAYVVAALLDEFYRAPSVRLSAEIRSWEAGLGLDEMDRRRLQWEMPIEPATRARPARQAADPAPKRAPVKTADPRKRFRVVA